MSLLAAPLHDDNQVQDAVNTLDDEDRNLESYYEDDLEEDDDGGVNGITRQNLCIVGFLPH